MEENREVSKEDLILQIASQGKFDTKINKQVLLSKKITRTFRETFGKPW